MDYDDNDFQSQNVRLTGESNTDFPPVIQPYPLPKFEFEDGLSGHLRFDSLVETEVFLGIESQEDNHWIEDFSQGGTGIEFSPRAAESCSISRRKDAWSAATSSESVEMLLKSVGQEEMTTGKAVDKDSGLHEEQGNLMQPMESTIELDSTSLPKTGDIVESGLTVLSGNFLGSFPHSSKVSKDNAMQGETAPHTSEDESSGPISSSNFKPKPVSEKCHLPEIAGRFLDDSKGNGVNCTENFAVHESQGDKAEDFPFSEDQSSDKLIAGSSVTSTPNVIVATGELSSQASTVISVGEPDQQVAEVHSSSPVQTSQGEAMVAFCKVQEIDEPCGDERDKLPLVLEGGTTTSEGHYTAPGTNLDSADSLGYLSTVVKKDDEMLEVGHQSDNAILGSNSEASQLSVKENKLAKGQIGENGGSEVEEDHDMTLVCSSHELLVTRHDLENLNNVHDSPGIHRKNLNPEDKVSSSTLDDSIAASEEKVVSCQMNVLDCDQGDSVTEKGDPKLGTDTSNVECQVIESAGIDQMPGYSSVCKIDADDVKFDKSESDTPAGHESASVVPLVDDVPLPSQDGLTSNELVEDKHIPIVESKPLDKNDEIGTKMCTDSSLLTLKTCPEMSGALDVAGGEESVSSDAGQQLLSDAIILPHSAVEKFNVKSCSEAQTAITQEVLEPLAVSAVCESEVKDGISAETMFVRNTEEESAKTSCEGASLIISDPNEIPNDGEMFPVQLPLASLESYCGDGQEDNPSIMSEQGNHEQTAAPVSGDPNRIPTNSEMFPAPLPPLSLESYNVDGQEDKQTSLVAELRNHEQIAAPGTVLNATEGSHSPAPLPEVDSKSSLIESGEPEKPNCGSPTVISCIEFSPNEKEMEVGVKGSADHNAVVDAVDVDGSIDNFSTVSLDLKGNDTHRDDKTFTFEVTPSVVLSEKEASESWKPFSSIQADQPSVVVEGSHTSSLNQMDSKVAQDTTCGTPLVSGSQIVRGDSKNASDHKRRRAPGKAAGKEASKKSNRTRETGVVSQPERGNGSCTVSPVRSMSRELMQSEGMLRSGQLEHNNPKPCGALSTLASDLPDLNASASPPSPGMLSQPFTDLQQVQLRAQIFVYGSLIQGGAPDEPCMMSAFGASDGGRSIWENTWLACVERVRGQKFHPKTQESPSQSCSGTRCSDLTNKHSSIQTKVSSTPVGRGSNKFTPSAALNSMIAVPSPLWSTASPSSNVQQSSSMQRGAVQDYHQVLSPLHAYQTPPLRNTAGQSSWFSQASFPVPWITSQAQLTPAPDANVRFSTVPITEAVRLTPVRDSSVSHSIVKHVSASPTVSSVTIGSISGVSASVDLKKGTVSPGQHPADLKRKRKKVPVSQDPGRISLLSTQAESALGTDVSNGLSTFVAATTPTSSKSKIDTSKGAGSVSPTSAPSNVKLHNQDGEQSIALTEETLHKVKEAKVQAEEAAALASVAVNHSQEVWALVDEHKKSGLPLDVESALASAAVAVAAAVSISKAAAAAAKIASNAALQAKLMADEALVASGNVNLSQSNRNSVDNLGSATQASILKGVDGASSASSIIVAAKEASRRRVEAACAASKQAENLDALVKAAELASEAVLQTGKIVAMGNPLPLSQLAVAGPESCLRSPLPSAVPAVKSNNLNRIQSTYDNLGEGPDVFTDCSEGPLGKVETQIPTHVTQSTSGDAFRESIENHVRLVEGMLESATNSGIELEKEKGHKMSDSTKTIGVVPESEFGPRFADISDQNKYNAALGNLKEDILEGSLVEIFKDGDGYKAAWFLANVLSVKDGKAYLCYKDLQSDEGLGQLKEWVTLESEEDKAPRIRIGRALTTTRPEGTRKRQRSGMGYYTWSVGDRVDVWMKDCWWEGVIAEKNNTDETMYSVQFQAQGETSVVRAWHLRPSLIWKDGTWVEWSRGDKFSFHEGDMPLEKRPRLVKEKEKEDRPRENVDESGRHDEPLLHSLSASEKIFNAGKASADVMKANKNKTQAGLRKEGTGVIFGVPKPGKKRKFMEVSKHYVADLRSNTNEVSGSKVEKYLMPQASGSRVASREKRAEDSKPKPIKSGKVQNVANRSGIQKNNLLNAATSTHDYRGENAILKQNASEFRSLDKSQGGAGGPTLLTDVSLSKKMSTSNIKSEPVNKGKPDLSEGKLAKIEEDKVLTGNSEKPTSEVIEPRRSNRRIQPTSRLLEGLQSSTMIISKIPSISHDKGHRSQNKSGFTRGKNFKF